jgi:hypothetical protein
VGRVLRGRAQPDRPRRVAGQREAGRLPTAQAAQALLASRRRRTGEEARQRVRALVFDWLVAAIYLTLAWLPPHAVQSSCIADAPRTEYQWQRKRVTRVPTSSPFGASEGHFFRIAAPLGSMGRRSHRFFPQTRTADPVSFNVRLQGQNRQTRLRVQFPRNFVYDVSDCDLACGRWRLKLLSRGGWCTTTTGNFRSWR